MIGTAGSEEGMALVKKSGADHVFCHKNKDYHKKIMVRFIYFTIISAYSGKNVTIIIHFFKISS